ncbi:acetyltransferase [Pelagibius litoralis]|nr:acetyltransferase [Pelagibius litoralis]
MPGTDKQSSRKVILFGAGALARLAYYCLSEDSPRQVAAFAVDEAMMKTDRMLGLPVVPFESLSDQFPAESHDLLIAVGPHDMNRPRADRFTEGKAMGYRFANYIASRALLWPDLDIGEGCMIFENTVVEPFTSIGSNVVLRAGVHVSHDGRIGDHCFLAPRVAIAGGCTIESHCFLGINATLRDGVTLAKRCMLAAGAVATRSTEPGGLYVGVPAKRSTDSSNMKL